MKKLDGKGAVVGLASIDKNIIIGRSDGTVNVHNRSKKKHDAFRTVLNDDATMNVLVYNEKRNVFATGGENNDLKVWDVNTRKDIFKAKSVSFFILLFFVFLCLFFVYFSLSLEKTCWNCQFPQV